MIKQAKAGIRGNLIVEKPIVHYKEMPASMASTPKVGHVACVLPLDHPSANVSNNNPVITSKVIAVTEDGFETQNTIYVKETP